MSEKKTLLSVQGLTVNFFSAKGIVRAVQDVSFSIAKGQMLALVGESGCGKTATALSIMRLIPADQGKIVSGKIVFEGMDLLTFSDRQMRHVRGNDIAIIFQEPAASLNPVQTVGRQIAECIRAHKNKDSDEAWDEAVQLLTRVGIAEAEQRARQYPHELSGGMQQRVMIAMAISCGPKLLIADEPTTGLDLTVQAEILELLDELRAKYEMSVLLITHNVGIVAERADEVAVMYASRIVEIADSQRLLTKPLHPYTKGLVQSQPRLGMSARRLYTIPGTVADPVDFLAGCKFHPRCRTGYTDRRCQTEEPILREIQPGRCVACWYASGKEKPTRAPT
jgi:oligopeptide/dipeptide ABC transporter ATP-binding protein